MNAPGSGRDLAGLRAMSRKSPPQTTLPPVMEDGTEIREVSDSSSGGDDVAAERPPRRSGDAPRRSGDAPRRSGDPPRPSLDAARRSGDAPKSQNSARRSEDTPRSSGDVPGRSGDSVTTAPRKLPFFKRMFSSKKMVEGDPAGLEGRGNSASSNEGRPSPRSPSRDARLKPARAGRHDAAILTSSKRATKVGMVMQNYFV